VYTVAGTLRAVPFDLRRREVSGASVLVQDGVGTTRIGVAQAAISGSGSLVYIPGAAGARRTVASVDRKGHVSPLPGLPPDIYRQLRVSPDGTRLAFSASGDIWVYDFARAARSPLTTEPGSDTNPVWTPDGQRIIFTSYREGYPELFWRPSDGTGRDERLLTRARDLTNLFASGWSKDGRQLLFNEVPANLQAAIGHVAVERPSDASVLVQGSFGNARATVHPDGRWMAYETNATGRWEIVVERYPELGNREPISAGGGRDPRWSRDGRELFFSSEDGRQIFTVPVQAGTTFVAGRPRVLLEVAMIPPAGGDQSYDVAPDGRFLIIRDEGTDESGSTAPSMMLVQNWTEELKRLVPVN
jgi:serine/threonine-protein kinase